VLNETGAFKTCCLVLALPLFHESTVGNLSRDRIEVNRMGTGVVTDAVRLEHRQPSRSQWRLRREPSDWIGLPMASRWLMTGSLATSSELR
jgi:hypothetical protein